MNYYHDEKNAKSYVEMCEGYNATKQLNILYEVLPDGAKVLELGSGPGNDLELLNSHYKVTGSDYSPAFIDILGKRFPEQSIELLDAITIDTEGPFDAIYSNKVLHHLSDKDLIESFQRQSQLLVPGGFVFHLIWSHIDAPEDVNMLFEERDKKKMESTMGSNFKVVKVLSFGEFEDGDSLAILAQKI